MMLCDNLMSAIAIKTQNQQRLSSLDEAFTDKVRYALMMRQSCIAFIASRLAMALFGVRQVPTDYPISLTWHGLTRRNHNQAISASDLK